MTEERCLEIFVKVAYNPGSANIANGAIEANMEVHKKEVRKLNDRRTKTVMYGLPDYL